MSEQSYSLAPIDYSNTEANQLPKLSFDALEVLNCVQQVWWKTSTLLTPDTVCEHLPLTHTRAKQIWNEPAFGHALRKKGLLADGSTEYLLSSKQKYAADLILNRHDTRSFREKLKEAGTTTTEWQAWLNKKAFVQYLEKVSGVDFSAADYVFRKTVLNGMDKGDIGATKLYAEVRGFINNKVQIDVNFNVVIQQIVEVLKDFIPQDRLIEAGEALERIYAVHTGHKNVIDAAELAPAIHPDI